MFMTCGLANNGWEEITLLHMSAPPDLGALRALTAETRKIFTPDYSQILSYYSALSTSEMDKYVLPSGTSSIAVINN